ncbi:Asp23/Gls24 family envelope stress response protein [Actinacidiphila acididurans]|uniref:Asp23/Gls24 family envelope stress response protein n=1 Tax=Actinacidiphila acididurans TaxID=2784346 RepID=A0ABS2TRI9_9ACTN|nr:Asp23/Gls24 family envelope stress response protein [Actinacidiphila acididurans]MBM9504578.1 Asp23/Gls24 family envelope stress response protein [Actinacidiphila acididurans]
MTTNTTATAGTPARVGTTVDPVPQTEVGRTEKGSFRVPAERGRTSIANSVVEKIAGMAAREVIGVHDFGGSLARSLGAVRDRVPGGRPSVTRGVKVEVGERQTAVDLELVVEYGVAITDVAADVRENVIAAVERMTGLEVVEVNVSVVDVHLPYDDEPQETRVQ